MISVKCNLSNDIWIWGIWLNDKQKCLQVKVENLKNSETRQSEEKGVKIWQAQFIKVPIHFIDLNSQIKHITGIGIENLDSTIS